MTKQKPNEGECSNLPVVAKKELPAVVSKETSLATPQRKAELEQARLEEFRRRKSEPRPPTFALGKVEGKKTLLSPVGCETPEDWENFRASAMEATGAANLQVGSHLTSQALNTLDNPQDEPAVNMNLVTAMMHGIKPKNELEGMLASQMVGAHNAAMKFTSRATQAKDTKDAQIHANLATKFMNAFTRQIDALQKLRGKGSSQTVRVEHVTVESGGQAIVGNVSNDKRGEGEREQ